MSTERNNELNVCQFNEWELPQQSSPSRVRDNREEDVEEGVIFKEPQEDLERKNG